VVIAGIKNRLGVDLIVGGFGHDCGGPYRKTIDSRGLHQL